MNFEDYDDDGLDPERESEDESESEQEIEMHVCELASSLTSLNIRLVVTDNCEGVPHAETLTMDAVNKVASMEAHILYRDKWPREDFFLNMDALSHDTEDLARKVFDRKGIMKKQYIRGFIWRGSGAFSDNQLDRGTMAVITRLSITKDMRRKGIGKRMVELLFEKSRGKGVCWVFTWPTQLNTAEGASDSDPDIFRRNEGVARHFWRSVGFRRVGASHWFCYAIDQIHKSRAIKANEDYDPPPEREIGDILLEMEEKCPLHLLLLKCGQGIATKEEVIATFDTELKQHSVSAPQWSTTDSEGNTILHTAVKTLNLDGIRWIRANLGSILDSKQNDRGQTPLEEMKEFLENSRASYSWMYIAFKGHDDNHIQCLQALLGDTADLSLSHTLRLKYGCTCGKCVGGFISPRMKFTLSTHASVLYDIRHDSGQMNYYGDEDEDDDGPFEYDNLTQNTKDFASKDRTFGFGILETLLWVSISLEEDLVPNTENIQAQILRGQSARYSRVSQQQSNAMVAKFLSSGGTVTEVVNMVLGTAYAQDDETGDGWFNETYGDELEALLTCRNDREFGMIKALLGTTEA